MSPLPPVQMVADIGSPVRLPVLLTGFRAGPTSLAGDAVYLLAAAAYLAGVRRLRRRGRRWRSRCTLGFLGGLAGLFIATGSGLAAYDDVNLSAHVVQHLFLMMVAPPFLALGRPLTLMIQAGGRRVQLFLVRVLNSRVLRWVNRGPSTGLFYLVMWLFFTTPVYGYDVTHPLFHDASHVILAAAGYLYWHGLVGLDGPRRDHRPGLSVGLLAVGMPLESFLALYLMSMREPIAAGYTVSGTHFGGEVFWFTSMLASTVALLVALQHLWRSADHENREEDRRVAVWRAGLRAAGAPGTGPGAGPALEATGPPAPAGWTRPWWLEDPRMR